MPIAVQLGRLRCSPIKRPNAPRLEMNHHLLHQNLIGLSRQRNLLANYWKPIILFCDPVSPPLIKIAAD
ncbi:hypothetical protein DSUL_140072 [Desulfovibrionales bacterium]